MNRRVTVRVPATTANLGSGFDCVGMAFDWYDELTLEVLDEPGLELAVTGEGAHQVPRDERHLVIQSVRAGLAAFGAEVPGMRLTSHNTIPHSRGLGSSASAIVGGLALAWGVAHPDEPIDRSALTRLATAAEGHPDNAGAAVWGGAILAWAREGKVSLVQLELPEGFRAVAFVPSIESKTNEARAVLPDTVTRADAVHQAIAAAALPLALTKRPDLLFDATADLLHQQYRAPMMPSSYDLMLRLREQGVPAAVSGAGPTVIAVGLDEQLAGVERVDTGAFAVRHLRPAAGVDVL
ncbi:MAG: homoserine kinase [Propionibacteriaceae bacterium]|nr:homoserine kinase [Propionibacteriaceae bacterium]